MKIIAHRGNLRGPSPAENHPYYIKTALNRGFDVEVDVWLWDDKIYLGHDEPGYRLQNTIPFLQHPGIWAHAKNIGAMDFMLKNSIHCFWHEQDKLTLTSRGIPWCYPGTYIERGVFLHQLPVADMKPYGLCTDWALNYV
jgi:hypothetical protein